MSEHPLTFEELDEWEEERIREMIASDSYYTGELIITDELPNGDEYTWFGWWWIDFNYNLPR